jgi:hypothetical protein
MRFIAHRGNVHGRIQEFENKPDYIDEALGLGYDVEVDVWVFEDTIYLGHDGPDTKVTLQFLLDRKDKLWCHAKNLDALTLLLHCGLHCFTHDTDDYTITSLNHIWAFPGKDLNAHSICVMPERAQYEKKELENCYAICTDDITHYEKMLCCIDS